MRQDPAFKDIFAYGFMAEELMRWFVGDLNGARALVDALDFSRLLRVQEQSTTGRVGDKRSYANDIVWRVPFRGRVVDGDDRAGTETTAGDRAGVGAACGGAEHRD